MLRLCFNPYVPKREHKPLKPNKLCSDLQSTLETWVQTSGNSQLSERGSVIHHTSVINSSTLSSDKPSPAFLYSQASQLTSCHPEAKQETLAEDLLHTTSTCNSATLFWDERGCTQCRTAREKCLCTLLCSWLPPLIKPWELLIPHTLSSHRKRDLKLSGSSFHY